MNDMHKTKAQLVDELHQLRERVTQLEARDRSTPSPDRLLMTRLVNQMLEPTVLLDFDGNLLHGNSLAAEVLGFESAGEIAGLSLSAIMHPDSIAQAAADLAAVKASEADLFGSYKLLVDARTIRIESHGTKIELPDGPVDLVSFRDATARLENEEHDQANKLILRSVLDHSSTVIFVKDIDGRYLLINKRYEELFGVTNDEIVGKTDFDIFPPEAAAQFQAKDRKAIEVGGPIEEEERVPQEDGPHTYLSVKFPLYRSSGEPFATCGIATDITKRKQAEESLSEHHELLEERVAARTRELTESNQKLLAEIGERARAEEQLAEFQRMAEASGSGLGMADLDGKTTYLNPELCRMLELDRPEDGYGKPIREFHPRDSWRILDAEALPRVRDAGQWDGETTLISKSGKVTPVIQSLFILRDEQGNPLKLASVLTDITERQIAEDALKESESKFRHLAETTSAIIMMAGEDGRIFYANRAAEEISGYTIEELSQLEPMADLFAMPDEQEKWMADIERAARTGETLSGIEMKIRTKDGQERWLEASGRYIRLGGQLVDLSTSFDITERKKSEKELKRAQQDLKESEERYRTIFDTAGTGMISFGEDAVITVANEEWAKLSGYSIEETVGKLTWIPFFTEESLIKMKKYHEMRRVDPDSVLKAYEAQFVDRRGRIHEGIINIQVVPGTQQRVASFQDLTALKRAQNEMYRADKMAALGQIIAGVAHEINNPNNFIFFNLPILRKYIEAIRPMLEHHLEDDPDLKILNMPFGEFLEDVFKLLENMEHGSRRITGIVSELKTYVRSDEEGEIRPGELGPVIDRVMALVGKQVRKSVKRFEVDVAPGLPPVRMNPGKIEQVLINLVINSGQAADKEDSWVKLTARVADEAGLNWVELLIADNGAGIPIDIRDQIFEPFFTSKGRDQGTGLGLSISQRILEEHNGSIDVESTVGSGTTFIIRLPAVSQVKK